MIGFYLSFLAVLLAGLGARDQIAVAALTSLQGARPGVLLTALAVSLLTAALAALAAAFAAPLLAPPARLFLAGLVLALAGGESLVRTPRPAPREPTHSLSALAIVIAAHQITDAARFTIFGIGAGVNAPFPAGLGGGLAACVLIGAAWRFPGGFMHPRVRRLRRAAGVILLLTGLFVCLRAIGKL